MGFGTVAAQTILFISVIVLSTGMVYVYKSVVSDASDSMRIQGNVLSNRIKTDIEITSVAFFNSTNKTVAYIKNTGKTRLDISKVDIFIDNARIPRDSQNRSIEVLPDSEIHNIGTWDPGEDIEVEVFAYQDTGISHSFQATTQYAISDIETFS